MTNDFHVSEKRAFIKEQLSFNRSIYGLATDVHRDQMLGTNYLGTKCN